MIFDPLLNSSASRILFIATAWLRGRFAKLAMRGAGVFAGVSMGVWLLGVTTAYPANIGGAWATAADQCGKIYSRRGQQVVFSPKADLYGSGFVIDDKTIRGKMARCIIKSRKDDGQQVDLIAACSTDIAVETMQFSLRILGEDVVERIYPGFPELNTRYSRCVF